MMAWASPRLLYAARRAHHEVFALASGRAKGISTARVGSPASRFRSPLWQVETGVSECGFPWNRICAWQSPAKAAVLATSGRAERLERQGC